MQGKGGLKAAKAARVIHRWECSKKQVAGSRVFDPISAKLLF